VSAVHVDLTIEQGSDWAGISVPMLDSADAPFDVTACSAHGQIKLRRGDAQTVFTWSDDPDPGEGLITLTGTSVAWRVLASESDPWTFSTAEYQIELHDPNASVGNQQIRVAQGRVLLDATLDRAF
jgi:hypothetical protein